MRRVPPEELVAVAERLFADGVIGVERFEDLVGQALAGGQPDQLLDHCAAFPPPQMDDVAG